MILDSCGMMIKALPKLDEMWRYFHLVRRKDEEEIFLRKKEMIVSAQVAFVRNL